MKASVATLVFLLLAWPARVWAGNDDELLAGNEAAMMAGAVSAFVRDGSAAWYNPAGLGAVERDQVDVSGTVYTLRLYSAPAFLRGRGGASDDASVTEFVSIPTQIAFARRVSSGLTLALGYFVPQATNLVLREQLAVDTRAQHEAWQVAFATSRTLHNATAALGFALTPHVRVGVGLIASYQTEAESSVVFQAVSQDGAGKRVTQVTAIGTGSRIAFEFALGMQAELTPRWSIGLSARAPRVQLARSSDYLFTRGAIIVFVDGWELHSVETGFRERWTEWFKKNRQRVSVHMLVRSKLLEMAISLVNLFAETPAIRIYAEANDWQRTCAAYHPGFTRASSM